MVASREDFIGKLHWVGNNLTVSFFISLMVDGI